VLNGCRENTKGSIGMMNGVGVGGPLGRRGLVHGMMPVEGIQCPKGGVN